MHNMMGFKSFFFELNSSFAEDVSKSWYGPSDCCKFPDYLNDVFLHQGFDTEFVYGIELGSSHAR